MTSKRFLPLSRLWLSIFTWTLSVFTAGSLLAQTSPGETVQTAADSAGISVVGTDTVDAIADTIAAAADTSLAALVDTVTMTPGLPDTVWAVQLGGRIATLDSALAGRDRLQEEGVVAFARVRAGSTAYWYELFAGPTATRAEVDSLRVAVGRLGWLESLDPARTCLAILMLGVVGQPPEARPTGLGTFPDPATGADPRQGSPEK